MARTPCKECGGAKEDSVPKGSWYCADCSEIKASAFKRATNALRRQKAAEERKANGTTHKNHPDVCPEGKKWCPKCESYLPLQLFNKTTKYASYCKGCQSNAHHDSRMRGRYNLEPNDYVTMLAAQGGRCAICKNRPGKKRFAVDHDHKTGKVRGLLCTTCNHRLLGAAKDSIEVLEAAIKYLKEPTYDKIAWTREHEPVLPIKGS